MTKEKWAELLTGREIGSEVTKEESEQAKSEGIVIVYGASDDLMEFEGALRDEADAPGNVSLTPHGLLASECDQGGECYYFLRIARESPKIEALWAATIAGPAWTYETVIPHATFDVYEDGEVYCRGIVFALADIP